MPNILLVYPEFPDSYWSFKYALPFIRKRATMPPLGLLTVAGMFPQSAYHLRVVDMNVDPLRDADLQWAHAVFASSMLVQKESLFSVAKRCNAANIPIVVGGPYPTSYASEIQQEMHERECVIDHIFCGEAEEGFLDFLNRMWLGKAPRLYGISVETYENRTRERESLSFTPPPRYDLVQLAHYASVSLQYTRGCPFACDFCDIPALYGGQTRAKNEGMMMHEFQLLYDLGWRGSLFLVDDNFVGKIKQAEKILPEIAKWQKERGYPFSLYTEASVNVAREDKLLRLMGEAGFGSLFLGIESPNEQALLISGKKQNVKRGMTGEEFLLDAIHKIQRYGMGVTAGFIIGLDGDTDFSGHVSLIQKAGIAEAMVGLLTVLKATPLSKRLTSEGRFLGESSGNNTDTVLNFVPQLPRDYLIKAYKSVISTLYDLNLKNYFERSCTLLHNISSTPFRARKIGRVEVTAFLKSVWYQMLSRQGPAYASFLRDVWRECPHLISEAVTLAIKGYHFEKVTAAIVAKEAVSRVF